MLTKIQRFESFDSRTLQNDTIDSFVNIIDWQFLSGYSKLDEKFISKYKKYIHWGSISDNPNIIFTESFIRRFASVLSPARIIIRRNQETNKHVQYFSIDFFKSMKKFINWQLISEYYDIEDDCVEEFIEEFIDLLHFNKLLMRRNLSNELVTKHYSILGKYVSTEEEKIKKLLNFGYTIVGRNKEKWVECYKSVRSDFSSIYNPKFVYDKLDYVYETECDYCTTRENSWGFSCWDKKNAKLFGDSIPKSKLIKVIVPIKDMCILPNGKIRSSKLVVTDLFVDPS
jgi:hypothetical protein